MNHKIHLLPLAAALAAIFTLGTAAWADDAVSRATPTHHQMMKDCLEKQKTADVTMSKTQMKRMCREQFKRQKATGMPSDAPPTDTAIP